MVSIMNSAVTATLFVALTFITALLYFNLILSDIYGCTFIARFALFLNHKAHTTTATTNVAASLQRFLVRTGRLPSAGAT